MPRRRTLVSISLAFVLAVAAAPASASAPPTLTGEWVLAIDDYGPSPDFTVDCFAQAPFLQWAITQPAGIEPLSGEVDPAAPYHGSFSETGRTWRAGLEGAPAPVSAVSDPQIHFELTDAGGLRFRGVESGPGGMSCVPVTDDDGNQLPYIADHLYRATPSYLVKIYTPAGTYVDRGTSALDWAAERCCIYRRHFEESWRSSLPHAVRARHVSSRATADRVVARGRVGDPSSRLRIRAHSTPTGGSPVGRVRIRGAQRFRGAVTCLEVLDGNVGLLAASATGGVLIHLREGGRADGADVTLLSAPDFARQQAIGCAPVAEPAGALTRARVSVTDALP